MRRLSISVCLVSILSLVLAAPALAAPPSNDTFAGAVVIGSLPFTDTVDTTEATTDAVDEQANEECGAPATDASVWYSITPTSDMSILVDASDATYGAGILVVTGAPAPGTFEHVACGPFAIAFSATAGVTYSIVVFDFQEDGGGNGGILHLTVDVAPPPPVIEVTVDPVGQFDSRTGSATVSGTVTCTGDSNPGFLDVQLRQRAGRVIISGSGGTGFACDGTTQEWTIEIFGDNGLFKGGRAEVLAFAIACGEVFCGETFQETTVHLRGG